MGGEARKQAAEALLDAANTAASRAQAAWLFFLGVSAFLFITISSVTHATLLLDTPVRLPLFQVNMRAYAFFLVAPVIYVFVHLGVLVQHRTLRAKLEAFNHALEALKPEEARHLRTRLNIYTYAQFMAGGERGAFALVVAIIAWLTLAVMPLLLLAYFQASFLPYHDTLVTWANRLTLTADAIAILLSGLFCTRLKEPGTWRAFLLRVRQRLEALPKALRHFRQSVPHVAVALWQGLRLRFSNRKPFVAMLNTTFAWLAIFYAFLVATVPGEGIDEWLCGKDGGDRFWCRAVPWTITEKEDRKSTRTASAWFFTPAYGWDFGDVGTGCCSHTRYAFLPTAWLFERGANHVSGLSNSPLGLARNLIISNMELNSEGHVSLRGRDLRYATLTHVVLRHADFTGADLTHADFTGSDLTGARFGCANTGRQINIRRRDAEGKEEWLDQTPKVKCTNLLHAEFSGATLDIARFTGEGRIAVLTEDKGASPYKPSLSFAGISMKGAQFDNVVISTWSFQGTDLLGAQFKDVDAQLVDFSQARLYGVKFVRARLEAASFSDADLTGAVFDGWLRAEAADFSTAIVWHTQLPRMSIEQVHDTFRAAHFSGLSIKQPNTTKRTRLKLQLASLSDSALRQRLQQRLATVLNDEPWQGQSRSLWEVLQEPQLACKADEDRRLLQAMELRAKVLAERFCHGPRKLGWGISITETDMKLAKALKERAIEFVADKWRTMQFDIDFLRSDDAEKSEKGGSEENKESYLRYLLLTKRMKKYRERGILLEKKGEKGRFAYRYLVDITAFINACGVGRNDLKDEEKQFAEWKKDFIKQLQPCAPATSTQKKGGKAAKANRQ